MEMAFEKVLAAHSHSAHSNSLLLATKGWNLMGEETSYNRTDSSISAAERQATFHIRSQTATTKLPFFPASAVTADTCYQCGVRLLFLIVSIGLRTAEKLFPRSQRLGWAGRGRSALPCFGDPSYISFCTRSRCAPAPLHPRPESRVPRRSQLLRRRRSQSCMRDWPRGFDLCGICVRSRSKKRRPATLPTPASHADVRNLHESWPARTSGSCSSSWQPTPMGAGPCRLQLRLCRSREQTDGPPLVATSRSPSAVEKLA